MENSNFRAQFLDHQIINSIVFYTISMVDPQSIKTYFLTSRYSSLRDLHESLKQKYPQEMKLPEFPPKKWFGNLNESFIAKRKKLLEDYFNAFLINASLVKDPITLQYFEMMENEKLNNINGLLSLKDFGKPLKISVSRKYNVKMFFDEYDAINSNHLQHKNSFSMMGFCSIKALADLKKLKSGEMHVQSFLMSYNLLLNQQEIDWNIISVIDSHYFINNDTRSCSFHIIDKGKKKIYTVKLVEFLVDNEEMLFQYITELFNLMYISKQIQNPYILLAKKSLYFEKEDRLCRDLKKYFLIIREHTPFNLKEAIEIRRAKNLQWSTSELLNIFGKIVSLFFELEKIGISHNHINLESIFFSKSDNCYKVGRFYYSFQESLTDLFEGFFHFKENNKYNSPEIKNLLNKEDLKKEDFIKLDFVKNDVFALGLIFFEMFNLSTLENESVLLEKLKIISLKKLEKNGPDNVILEIINSMLIENPTLRFSFKRLWETFFFKEKYVTINSEIILFNDLEIMMKEIHPEVSQFKTKIKRLNMIAHAYNRLGNSNSALEIYEDIFLQIKKAQLSPEEKQIKEAKFIRKMSLVYHEIAEYKKADQYLKISLEKIENLGYETQKQLYGQILMNLSHNSSAAHDFLSSYSYLEKAIELYALSFGEKSSEIADIYNDLGFVCEKLGEHEKALKYLELALTNKKQLQKLNIGVGKILINLGLVYQGMEKYEKSLEYFNEALVTFQSIYGKISPNISRIKNMIGGVYLLKKEYVESLKYLEEAWAFIKEIAGEKNLVISDVFFNLGKCYWNTRNFEKAEFFLKQSKNIRKKNLGSQHIEVAEVRNVLGCLYLELLTFEKARKNMHAALKIFKRVLGKSHLHIAELYNNYGYIHTKLNNLKKAKKCHERCLNIYTIHLGKEHRYISITLNNLGSICLETGDFEEAAIHFQEAVEILKKNNEANLNLANIYNLLGITYCNMNQYRDALDVLESAYKIYSLRMDKNNPKMIKLEKDIKKIKENA